MIDRTIEILLILLLIFTPIAFGSQVLWAFSLMELGILLIIILWAVQRLAFRPSVSLPKNVLESKISGLQSQIRNPKSAIPLTIVLLSLFFGVVLLQMIPLPSGVLKIISPKTYELRSQLSVATPITGTESRLKSSEIKNQKSGIRSQKAEVTNQESEIQNLKARPTNHHPRTTTLSFFPLATKVEFLKWLSLAGLFMFLLHWRLSDDRYRITHHLVFAVFLVAVFVSLYGIFEFLTGHRHVLNLDYSRVIEHVTGTFANRNCFAGYLLMAIPLSIGFFFSREADRYGRPRDWRHRLSSLDGKTLLIGFGLILMILGLLLSQSRAGIVSLLISFSLIILFFRGPYRAGRISKIPVLIFGLAVLWAAWVGLDAAISRFFSASEAFHTVRWPLWVGAFRILRDFPVFGSGLGTFTEVYSMYRTIHIVGFDIQAENDFLQLASEVGLIGAALLLVLLLFLFYRTVSGIRSLSHGQPQRYIGIGGLVGILALMVHSIVQKNLQLPANAFLYTITWAMLLIIAAGKGSQPNKRDTRYTKQIKQTR